MGGVVGREDELELLRAFLDREESPRALVLEGEPGIGKTTLWRYGVESARERGYTVLAAGPAASEAATSFVALADLLWGVVEELLPQLALPRRRALGVALRLEEAAGPPPDPLAISLAFVDALALLGRGGRVLLAIDDAQWLDPASQSVLEFAARRLHDAPTAVLVAARTGRGSPLGLDRALPGASERITLGPVSLGALHALLQERLRAVLARPVLRRLHELSAGNPFFALELARALKAGSIALQPGEPLPPDLDALVSARIGGLPEPARVALAAAAALSRPTVSLVPAADLEPAVAAQVVELHGDEIRFAHPLLASAAYARLPLRERRDLHRRLANGVCDVEERARHLALATENPDEEVAEAVEEAAGAAFRRGALAAAAELATEARRLTPSGHAEGALRRSLAEAEYRFEAGDTAAAAGLLEQLIAVAPHGPDRAHMLSRQARYRHFGEDFGGGVELLTQALAEAGEDEALRGEIHEGLVWGLLRRDVASGAEHGRAAVRIAEERGDPAALAEALAALGLIELARGGSWRGLVERALALEEYARHLRVLRHPSFAYGYCLSCADDLDGARRVFRELAGRATEHGDESALAHIWNHLALVEFLSGSWDLSHRLADEGHTVALQTGQLPSQASTLGKWALIAARRGAVEEARDAAGRSLELAAGPHLDPASPEDAVSRGGEGAIWALGQLALSLGEPAEAHRYLAPLARALLGAGLRDPGELRCLPDAIDALIALGRLEEAEALLASFKGCPATGDRPSALAAAERSRGLLRAARGDLEGALASLESAVIRQRALPLPFERAKSLLALGEASRRAKQRRVAREQLGEAAAEFEQLGAALWAGRARAELARIGGRAPSEGLTPTEQRVAELVATGRSNKEVAAELFVTAKTVETNLSRIYAKLGVRSRTELSRRLARKV